MNEKTKDLAEALLSRFGDRVSVSETAGGMLTVETTAASGRLAQSKRPGPRASTPRPKPVSVASVVSHSDWP